jgi:MFS family permease
MQTPETRPAPSDHALFIAVTLLYWLALYIYVPVLSPYLEMKGASYGFIGVVVGSYGFMQIVCRLPMGIHSDRMGRRKPYILLGMLTGTLSCLLFALFEPLGWTLVARATAGISASCWVAFTVMYAGFYPKEQATRAMSTISLLTAAGQLIGMAASGWLVELYGWRSVFWVGVAVGSIGSLLAVFLKEPKAPDRQPLRYEDIGQVLRNARLWMVSSLSILAHSVLFITMFGFTPSYAVYLGAEGFELTALSFAFMLPHAAASFLSGRALAPRFGELPLLLAGFLISGLCTLTIPWTRSLDMLMLTQAVNGFAQGLHFPLLLGMSIQTIDQNKRATAMGVYQAIYAVGMFAGPFVAGWVNGALGLAGGFYIAAAVALFSCAAAWLWRRRLQNAAELPANPAGSNHPAGPAAEK